MAILSIVDYTLIVAPLIIIALFVVIPLVASIYCIVCPWYRLCGGEPILLRR
ncbi:MAG: hypothetical protein JSV32_07135 [Dehalococcoidia bacterium]|nr:MAG: hypothetical protein JSV32_07135 [Dehalococcoidia bacterium]